jgi:hypothetical protein
MNPRRNRDKLTPPISPQVVANRIEEGTIRKIEIGPNHRRGITSALAHLDETICDIEQMVNAEDTSSELYMERNALSDSQKREVLLEIAALRRLLAELRQTLNLIPVTRDVGASVSGSCMLLWESVIELQGRYLKRYGEPPKDLVEFLDPKTDEIVCHLDRIVRVLGVFRLSGPSSGENR